MAKSKCYHSHVTRRGKEKWFCIECKERITEEEKRMAWKEYDAIEQRQKLQSLRERHWEGENK